MYESKLLNIVNIHKTPASSLVRQLGRKIIKHFAITMDHSANCSLRDSDKKLNIHYKMDKNILRIEVSLWSIMFLILITWVPYSPNDYILDRLLSTSPNWHRCNLATNTGKECTSNHGYWNSYDSSLRPVNFFLNFLCLSNTKIKVWKHLYFVICHNSTQQPKRKLLLGGKSIAGAISVVHSLFAPQITPMQMGNELVQTK